MAKKPKLKRDVMQKYASEIAKREGGKTQARIGDIRQILRIYHEILAEEFLNQK